MSDAPIPIRMAEVLDLVRRGRALLDEAITYACDDDLPDLIGFMEDAPTDVVTYALCHAVERLAGIEDGDTDE